LQPLVGRPVPGHPQDVLLELPDRLGMVLHQGDFARRLGVDRRVRGNGSGLLGFHRFDARPATPPTTSINTRIVMCPAKWTPGPELRHEQRDGEPPDRVSQGRVFSQGASVNSSSATLSTTASWLRPDKRVSQAISLLPNPLKHSLRCRRQHDERRALAVNVGCGALRSRRRKACCSTQPRPNIGAASKREQQFGRL